jgi:hypothetical protein
MITTINEFKNQINENSSNGIEISVEKLKEMFDEEALKTIFQPKDYTNVIVYAKNDNKYDVRFQDGKYLIEEIDDTSNHMSNTGELIEFDNAYENMMIGLKSAGIHQEIVSELSDAFNEFKNKVNNILGE